jgi:hypothetical protein
MAETAFQQMYRKETIAAFEVHQSLTRMTTTTEIQREGNEATFLVAGSGGATAVTRGVNGRIPGRPDDNTQVTATLVEWHDKVEKTRFNIFASQGNQRDIMQRTSVGVINRKIDDDIITELNTGTVNTGTAAVASMALVSKAKAILGNNSVPFDNNIYALITPAFEQYLQELAQFTSMDYVNTKPLPGSDSSWEDQQKMMLWRGVNWIVHPSLPGAGTNAEKCFMYHKSAIGHAMDAENMDTAVGYNDEDDYSFARCSAFMASKVLQNSGIVVMNHDGSALAAA